MKDGDQKITDDGKLLVREDIEMKEVKGPVYTIEQLDDMMASGQTIEITGPVSDKKTCEIPHGYDRLQACVLTICT